MNILFMLFIGTIWMYLELGGLEAVNTAKQIHQQHLKKRK